MYAIKSLKLGKSAGMDGVVAEILKCCSHFTTTFLCDLYNIVFNSGIYPSQWSKGVYNYRGVV